ncbi:MAG: NAD-dependent epimerase/dehydratase family protein [Promethearchaeota archaeon]
MKILVTGATGTIGEHLVNSLLEQKDVKVRILARDPKKIPKTWKGKVETVIGDITNVDCISALVKNVDTVYHLAAIPEISEKFSEEEYFKVNSEITIELALKCIEETVGKFVFFSSIEAVGGIEVAVKEKKPLNEKYQPEPTTLYGASKLKAERELLDLYQKRDFPVSIVRPTVVYGPCMRGHFGPFKLIKALDKGFFMFVGSGKNPVSWTYVKNVVDGAILVANSKKSNGQIYTLSDDKPYPFKEIVTLVCKYLNRAVPKMHLSNAAAKILRVPVEFAYGVLDKDPPLSKRKLMYLAGTYVFDTSKIRDELGFSSKIGLEEGVRDTIRWYKDENL